MDFNMLLLPMGADSQASFPHSSGVRCCVPNLRTWFHFMEYPHYSVSETSWEDYIRYYLFY